MLIYLDNGKVQYIISTLLVSLSRSFRSTRRASVEKLCQDPKYDHTRSNSFPSRSTPIVSQFDEQLNRLRSSELASTSSSKLSLLNDLYDCIDELLQLPSSQKAIANQEKWAENASEESIKFLDTCTTITDVLVQMKEQAQGLQSVLRRRCSKDEIAKKVAEYLRSRKNAIKAVSRALKDLKKIENEQSNEICDVVSRLRDCQMVTQNVLESILVSIAGAKAASSWESVVSKLLKLKRVANQQEIDLFLVGFEASDLALNPGKVSVGLENMEISLKNVEEGLDILYRHLIKTRTTILNILNF